MPTIAEMTDGKATLLIAYHGLNVHVQYYPGKITERVIAQIQSFAQLTGDDLAQGFRDLNRLLTDLIASWDLTENDGMTMFPLTGDRLAELPVLFRIEVLKAAMGDIRPND